MDLHPMKPELEDPQKAKDHAVCMAYDAFRLCMGNSPRTFTVMDVVRWLECVWHIDVREYLNRAAAPSPSPISPHEYQPHKKYPWFCRECGYAPHDTIKHKPHPEWTPQTRYCANCDSVLSAGDAKYCAECVKPNEKLTDSRRE